jgi:hypothetical protein
LAKNNPSFVPEMPLPPVPFKVYTPETRLYEPVPLPMFIEFRDKIQLLIVNLEAANSWLYQARK